jgi:hypothetical protein
MLWGLSCFAVGFNPDISQTSRLSKSDLINTPLQRGDSTRTNLKTVSTVYRALFKPLKRFEDHLFRQHPAEAGC